MSLFRWVPNRIVDRTFYSARRHGGCNRDFGWTAVIASKTDDCAWARTANLPMFLYSPNDTAIHFTTNSEYYMHLLLY